MIPKLTTSIAIEALATAKNPPAPRSVPPSVLAEKFVVRARKRLIQAMEELGKRNGRSANSEAVRAATASLEGRHEAITSINVLKAYLGPERTAAALQEITPYVLATAYGTSKKVIRLPDGVRDGISDAVDRSVAINDRKFPSMNAWFLDALIWWLNNQQELPALLKVCVELDRERAVS